MTMPRTAETDEAEWKAAMAFFRTLPQKFKEAKININLGFIPVTEHKLEETKHCGNQIMLRYKNGTFEILPLGINGRKIRAYIGIKYSRVTHWTALPRTYTGTGLTAQTAADIYYEP